MSIAQSNCAQHTLYPISPIFNTEYQLPKTKRQQQIVKTPVLHKKHLNENLKIAAKKTIGDDCLTLKHYLTDIQAERTEQVRLTRYNRRRCRQ